MKPIRLTSRVAIAAVALMVIGVAAAPLHAEDSKAVTVTGYVRDTGCLAMYNASGEKHRACSIACAAKGVPLGIEADDGKYYIAITAGHPPASANDLLSKYAEQKVKVTGAVGAAKGQNVIAVSSVEPAS